MSDNSVLPFNSSPVEKNIEQSIGRAFAIPVRIHSLWDAYACPSEFLPWLAWAMSVDHWDSTWTDDVKRELIANSVQIHREKGTQAAIERVLSVLGVTADIDEWFRYGGTPHTFRLTAWIHRNARTNDEAGLSMPLYDALKTAVDTVKPVRSHYELRIGAALHSALGFASAGSLVTLVSVTAQLLVPSRSVSSSASYNAV